MKSRITVTSELDKGYIHIDNIPEKKFMPIFEEIMKTMKFDK